MGAIAKVVGILGLADSCACIPLQPEVSIARESFSISEPEVTLGRTFSFLAFLTSIIFGFLVSPQVRIFGFRVNKIKLPKNFGNGSSRTLAKTSAKVNKVVGKASKIKTPVLKNVYHI